MLMHGQQLFLGDSASRNQPFLFNANPQIVLQGTDQLANTVQMVQAPGTTQYVFVHNQDPSAQLFQTLQHPLLASSSLFPVGPGVHARRPPVDDLDDASSEDERGGRSKKPQMQGRFSGRLALKEDERRLADECRMLAPLLGGVGKRGDRSRLTLAKIVRGIAAGAVRHHCEEREAMLASLKLRVAELQQCQTELTATRELAASLKLDLEVVAQKLASVDPDPEVTSRMRQAAQQQRVQQRVADQVAVAAPTFVPSSQTITLAPASNNTFTIVTGPAAARNSCGGGIVQQQWAAGNGQAHIIAPVANSEWGSAQAGTNLNLGSVSLANITQRPTTTTSGSCNKGTLDMRDFSFSHPSLAPVVSEGIPTSHTPFIISSLPSGATSAAMPLHLNAHSMPQMHGGAVSATQASAGNGRASAVGASGLDDIMRAAAVCEGMDRECKASNTSSTIAAAHLPFQHHQHQHRQSPSAANDPRAHQLLMNLLPHMASLSQLQQQQQQQQQPQQQQQQSSCSDSAPATAATPVSASTDSAAAQPHMQALLQQAQLQAQQQAQQQASLAQQQASLTQQQASLAQLQAAAQQFQLQLRSQGIKVEGGQAHVCGPQAGQVPTHSSSTGNGQAQGQQAVLTLCAANASAASMPFSSTVQAAPPPLAPAAPSTTAEVPGPPLSDSENNVGAGNVGAGIKRPLPDYIGQPLQPARSAEEWRSGLITVHHQTQGLVATNGGTAAAHSLQLLPQPPALRLSHPSDGNTWTFVTPGPSPAMPQPDRRTSASTPAANGAV